MPDILHFTPNVHILLSGTQIGGLLIKFSLSYSMTVWANLKMFVKQVCWALMSVRPNALHLPFLPFLLASLTKPLLYRIMPS